MKEIKISNYQNCPKLPGSYRNWHLMHRTYVELCEGIKCPSKEQKLLPLYRTYKMFVSIFKSNLETMQNKHGSSK